jgi:hypothetical protein
LAQHFSFLQNLSILNRIEDILPGAFDSNHTTYVPLPPMCTSHPVL